MHILSPLVQKISVKWHVLRHRNTKLALRGRSCTACMSPTAASNLTLSLLHLTKEHSPSGIFPFETLASDIRAPPKKPSLPATLYQTGSAPPSLLS